jgi:polygalacturonase
MKKSINLFILLLFCFSVSAQTKSFTNILDFGAKADGQTLITQNIKSAIDSLSAKGGGTLFFPAGEYLTGPIILKSNITIYIDAGAVLKFTDDFDQYLPFVQTRWEGVSMKSFCPLFYAYEAENITITGRGKIDGQGKKWWNEHLKNAVEYRTNKKIANENKWQKLWGEENKDVKVMDYYKSTLALKFFRPPFIQPYRCKNVLVEGITIVNSPFWTVNPEFCDNVTVRSVTILNPKSPNTDGVNPESCRNVHISDCHISVGDDCITIKSGRDFDGRNHNVPCENITITNCTMLSGHGGVVIGSEMSGSVRKVAISNCIFDGTDRGIRLKSMRGRGGIVEEIRVSNIVMKDIKIEAFTFDLYYGDTDEGPVSEETPCFRNIHISDVTGSNVKQACKIAGIKEMPITNLTFNNINIEAQLGFIAHTAKNIELSNVEISVKNGSPFSFTNTDYVVLSNIKSLNPPKTAPVLFFSNATNMFITNCFPVAGTHNFLKGEGEKSANILLKNNHFINTTIPFEKGAGLSDIAVIIKD